MNNPKKRIDPDLAGLENPDFHTVEEILRLRRQLDELDPGWKHYLPPVCPTAVPDPLPGVVHVSIAISEALARISRRFFQERVSEN